MKIYSYLQSGKAVLATNLLTHTQVLTPEVAMLAAPDPESFQDAMLRLARNAELRARLGRRARELAEERYSFRVFRKALLELYAWLDTTLP